MPSKDFEGLKAVFINCTLKPSSTPSHTKRLMKNAMTIMEANGVAVDYIHAADHTIAFGVQPDMRKEGASQDDWPDHIWPKIRDAHILVLGTPLWLGEESSICRIIIERLYAHSAQRNDQGQYIFYGKTGGAIITGNEDGVKHASMTCLYAMQHVGYTIPPQADCGWIGEAGPGLSYGDEHEDGSKAGFDNDFTQRNTTFMAWNLMHLAKMLKDNKGFPSKGNSVADWQDGARFDHPDIGSKANQ